MTAPTQDARLRAYVDTRGGWVPEGLILSWMRERLGVAGSERSEVLGGLVLQGALDRRVATSGTEYRTGAAERRWRPVARDVMAALRSVHLRNASEALFQVEVHRVLLEAGLPVLREVWLGTAGRDRVDFAIRTGDGLLVLELKIKGPVAMVERQIARYASVDEVCGIVLVSSRAMHGQVATEIGGKTVWRLIRADLGLA